MGFCLFNNVAILARYLQQHHGLDNILIIDWDVHHGNGTQHIFEDDPSVFYFSTHQYPFYPGTGAATETGSGRGKGYTMNVPLPAGTDDETYIDSLSINSCRVPWPTVRTACSFPPASMLTTLIRWRTCRSRKQDIDA